MDIFSGRGNDDSDDYEGFEEWEEFPVSDNFDEEFDDEGEMIPKRYREPRRSREERMANRNKIDKKGAWTRERGKWDDLNWDDE